MSSARVVITLPGMTGMFGGMATVDDLGATPKGGVRRLGPVSVMIRLVSVVAVVAFSAFVGGFLVFADQVTNSRPPATPTGCSRRTSGPSPGTPSRGG